MSNHFVFKSYVLDPSEIAGFRGALTGVNDAEIHSTAFESQHYTGISAQENYKAVAEKLPREPYQAALNNT